MYQLSANIELLFKEAGEAPDRVRAAAATGFDAVEMWFSTDKDLDALGKALADTGTQLTSLLAGPRMGYTFPAPTSPPSMRAWTSPSRTPSSSAARASCSPPGTGFPGMNRQKNLAADHRHVRRGGRADRGLRHRVRPRAGQLARRPPRRADRPHRRRRAVARAIGSDRFGILYDLYHSIVAGRGPGDRAGQRSRPREVRPARRRPRPRASPAAAESTGPRSWGCCVPPATTARSGWSTSRPSRRRSPSG